MSSSSSKPLTVKDIVPVRVISGEVGLEVEVEFESPLSFDPDVNIWNVRGDGSLRNFGYEFVTRSALDNDNKKLEHLQKLFSNFKKVLDTNRTSVHVHVNVQSLTPVQVWTFVCAYYLLENVLTEYCGSERVGNLYCLRLKDAEGLIKYIINDIESVYPFINIDNNRVKYAGCNIGCIPRFGSVEMRAMRGCYDADIIHEWSSALVELKYRAIAFRSPDLLLDAAWNDQEAIIDRLLPYVFVKKLKKEIPNWGDKILEATGLVSTIAYTPDWNQWADRVEDNYKTEHNKYTKLMNDLVVEQARRPQLVRRVRVPPVEEFIHEFRAEQLVIQEPILNRFEEGGVE